MQLDIEEIMCTSFDPLLNTTSTSADGQVDEQLPRTPEAVSLGLGYTVCVPSRMTWIIQ